MKKLTAFSTRKELYFSFQSRIQHPEPEKKVHEIQMYYSHPWVATCTSELLDAADYSPAVACLHFLQRLLQLLNQMEQGSWVCLQKMGAVVAILIKVQL